MNKQEPQIPKHWEMLHSQLQEEMQREVYLMRELLSNMHQEEISLMLNDKGSLQQILQQRSFLLEKLSGLRINKLETLKEIEHINPYFTTPLEINSLGDQLSCLTEKVHRQTSSNQRLSACPEHYYHLTEQIRPKKKLTIATLQIKK